MSMMDDLKNDLAFYLTQIEDRCKTWGLPGMDSTSLLARDRNNKEMSIWLSNDPDTDPLIWYPGSHLPDTSAGWLLAVLRPLNGIDYQEPNFYSLVAYDRIDGRWRSQFKTLDPHSVEVVKWSYLPKMDHKQE